MLDDGDELSIRSRNGLFRDLIPIYSIPQFVSNLAIFAIFTGLVIFWHLHPALLLLVGVIGWGLQFPLRPSVMAASVEQAAWLESVLDAQKFYDRSPVDGRWRRIGQRWWPQWPHDYIEFIPGNPVTVIAPRDMMDAMHVSLELLEEHGELIFAEADQPFAFEPVVPADPLPWHAHLPAVVIGTTCVVAWVWVQIATGLRGMSHWGVSSAALQEGRFETIILHMFAHGGAMHMGMNLSMLAAIGGTLTVRLGSAPASWLRFLLLFFFSGLAGAALYVALHPLGSVPMLGTSGALYGLFALLIRTSATDAPLLTIGSKRFRRIGLDLVKQNAFLFGLFALIAWWNGKAGGLAWEAHLGGFLFGLFVGVRFLPNRSTALPDERMPIALAPAD